jgi:hypothetical protein
LDGEKLMVKLRIINGGKESNESTEKIRLFSAYSVIDNFQGHDCVRLNWIHLERKFPIARYDRLIDGYDKIDERMRFYFEEYVKELFSKDEVELLRAYVNASFKTELYEVEETVPVSCIFVPMPYREIKPGGSRGFYQPVQNGGPALPFKTSGYYDLSKCPSSISIQCSTMEKGIAFLRESLKNLGIDADGYEPLLKGTVESIYDEFGFFVDRGKTLEERSKEREEFNRNATPPQN